MIWDLYYLYEVEAHCWTWVLTMDEKGRYWSSVKSWTSGDCLEHIPKFQRTKKMESIYLRGRRPLDLLLLTLLNTENDWRFENSFLFTDLIIDEKGISGFLDLTDLFNWYVSIYSVLMIEYLFYLIIEENGRPEAAEGSDLLSSLPILENIGVYTLFNSSLL